MAHGVFTRRYTSVTVKDGAGSPSPVPSAQAQVISNSAP